MKQIGDKNIIVLSTNMHHDVIRKAHDNGHFSRQEDDGEHSERKLHPQVKGETEEIRELLCVLHPS